MLLLVRYIFALNFILNILIVCYFVAFGAERCDEILNYLKDHPNYTKSILAYGIFRGFVDGENFADSQLICKTAVEYRMGTAEPYAFHFAF